MHDTVPSLFESLNAKRLTLAQVAGSFVKPALFTSLCKQHHTIVLGPRGSGKTTLLKMLTPQALDNWKGEEATAYRDKLGFTGVFIPTDISWQVDFDEKAELCETTKSVLSTLRVAAFTTHVLQMLVSTFDYLMRNPQSFVLASRPANTDLRKAESNIVNNIAVAWGLEPRIPSLPSLRYALDNRQAEIEQLVNHLHRTTFRTSDATPQMSLPPFVDMNFLTGATSAIRIFSDHVNLAKHSWALLFDELELAPAEILRRLLHALRGGDQTLIFKLTLCPYGDSFPELHNPTAAQPHHDFDVISLWYARKEENYAFSRQLAKRFASDLEINAGDVDALFGDASLDFPGHDVEAVVPYSPGSRQQKAFQSLATKDRSFAEYLRRSDISEDDPGRVEGNRRAAEVRKIIGLVMIRDAFLTHHADIDARPRKKLQSRQRRTRKNPAIYSGATTLYAVCEGNPRWLKAVIAELLKTTQSPRFPIEPTRQNRVVDLMANMYRALLKSLPLPFYRSSAGRGILDVVSVIGDYFFNEAVLGPFNADPNLTFIVDSHTPDALLELLGCALNAGAIVYIPDASGELFLLGSGKAMQYSLRGKRFRLSYLLSAHARLPLLLGKEVSLARILRKSRCASLLEEDTLFPAEIDEA